MRISLGRFELMEDEVTKEKYWFGAEEDWKEGTKIGTDDGTLILKPDAFPVGTVLDFSQVINDSIKENHNEDT